MKIKAPKWAIETNNEGIILFSAWLHRIASNEGFDISYYLHASDVRYMLQKYTTFPHLQFEGLEPYLRIGAEYNSMWSFRFLEEPETEDYQFRDDKFIFIYGFLLGREASTEIVQDGKPERPKVNTDIVMPENMRPLFTYYGMMQERGGGKKKGPNANRALTQEQAIAIREEYTGAWGQITKLANQYGVSHVTIKKIIDKKRYN